MVIKFIECNVLYFFGEKPKAKTTVKKHFFNIIHI